MAASVVLVSTQPVFVAVLAEPVVSALLAWLVLSGRPGLLTLLGGGVVLAGLYFLLKDRPGRADHVAGVPDHTASPGDVVFLGLERGESRSGLGPIRTGFTYGMAAVLVALVSDLYFLLVDPASTEGWILAVIAQYRTRLALAAILFLAILAALRVRPTRLDPEVPYHSLLLRDGALAATVVAVMVGLALFLTTALQATLFAGAMRDYAKEASPKIVSYVNEVREEIRARRVERGAPSEEVRDLPPPAETGAVEATLQPPTLRDLGRSIANFVLRAVLLGTLGGLVGLLRGRSSPREAEKPPRE